VSNDEEYECSLLPENKTVVYCSGLHPQTKVKEEDIVAFGSEYGRVLKAEKVNMSDH